MPQTQPAKKHVAKAVFKKKTFVDLFCGVGGFHLAAQSNGYECVFASEIDQSAAEVYEKNFGLSPKGDIRQIDPREIPDHELLCSGFPCQPFSIIGKQGGFNDSRGFLFFEVARIVTEKRPKYVLLENVKNLATAADGKILRCILVTLESLGYDISWRVLNALEHGLPQKRERVIIVASLSPLKKFVWPQPIDPPPTKQLAREKSRKKIFCFTENTRCPAKGAPIRNSSVNMA
jgi:DNA (cytosine-5)-methyltransferase 1